ncbi:MAG: hypothetical protein JXR36_04200 [Bacteroidales bacterium]|nr:hypothetical protein [Bacteroidales bacterium]
MIEHKGYRDNIGKERLDLITPFATMQLGKVLGIGADKYGDDNWKKGMSWKNVIASLKRHLAKFEAGEDYDKESGELHAAHIFCNAMFMLEYYKIYPQGDDRFVVDVPKIGLDIDDVLADFSGHIVTNYGIPIPEFWDFDWSDSMLKSISENKDFWLSMPVKTKPQDIPFQPHCYITSRGVPVDWTKEWLRNNGFPNVPLYSLDHNADKKKAVVESNCQIFVDDRYENFIEINKTDVKCFLFDAPHNQRYNVGYYRIKQLLNLPFFNKF